MKDKKIKRGPYKDAMQSDLPAIADFNRIVMNYIKMKRLIKNL